jgi:HPt (histidine-containing phosphotransfer) domain-containing protein
MFSKIYDRAGALRRMGDDPVLFQEMVGLLRADAPALLQSLRAAQQAGDSTRVHRAAHTLKGLASNFGAARTVAAATEAERLAKARQSAGMPAAIAELEEALDELIAALAPVHEMSQSG